MDWKKRVTKLEAHLALRPKPATGPNIIAEVGRTLEGVKLLADLSARICAKPRR